MPDTQTPASPLQQITQPFVDAARALADLRYRLTEGSNGLARARAGVTIAPGAVASWAGVYPYPAQSTQQPWYSSVASTASCPPARNPFDQRAPCSYCVTSGDAASTSMMKPMPSE